MLQDSRKVMREPEAHCTKRGGIHVNIMYTFVGSQLLQFLKLMSHLFTEQVAVQLIPADHVNKKTYSLPLCGRILQNFDIVLLQFLCVILQQKSYKVLGCRK